jgi:hypothetical protein
MRFQTTMRRADRQTALMRGMFDQLGIDVTQAASRLLGLELAGVVRVCMSCRNGTACGAWLRSGGRMGDRHRFCPNATALDRMRAAQEPQP